MTENKVKSMNENYESLKSIIEALKIDYDKFNNKKVKIAGSRVRNNLLNCKKLCDILRNQILTEIKDLPVKHRVKKEEKDYENPLPKTRKKRKTNKKKKD